MTYSRQLKRKIKNIIARLKKAAKKNRIGYFFDENCDVKITIDGNLKYVGVKICVAIGEKYEVYIDTSNRYAYSKIFGYLESEEFSSIISNELSDEIDDYFENYFETCR